MQVYNLLESIRGLAARSLTRHQIANELGVPYHKVCNMVKKHGIKCAPVIRIPPKLHLVLEAAAEGLTPREIAKRIGVTTQYISLLAIKYEIKIASGLAVSVRGSISTERLRDLLSEGFTRKEAAKELGIGYQNLCVLIRERGIKWPMEMKPATVKKIKRLKELAAKGYTKSEAASELGCIEPGLHKFIGIHLPEVKWRDGRKKG